jgi:hypothetical protein
MIPVDGRAETLIDKTESGMACMLDTTILSVCGVYGVCVDVCVCVCVCVCLLCGMICVQRMAADALAFDLEKVDGRVSTCTKQRRHYFVRQARLDLCWLVQQWSS